MKAQDMRWLRTFAKDALEPRTITMVAGIPGAGKTTLAHHLVSDLAALMTCSASVMRPTYVILDGQMLRGHREMAARLGMRELDRIQYRMPGYERRRVPHLPEWLDAEMPGSLVVFDAISSFRADRASWSSLMGQLRTWASETSPCPALVLCNVRSDGEIDAPKVVETLSDAVYHLDIDDMKGHRDLVCTKGKRPSVRLTMTAVGFVDRAFPARPKRKRK